MQSKTVYTSYYSLADKHKGKVTMSVINTHFIMALHGGINILGSHANMQATRGASTLRQAMCAGSAPPGNAQSERRWVFKALTY